jgi:hypothetical protein
MSSSLFTAYFPPKRIMAAITNPRMTMVSGMATRITIVAVSSGFSAREPAPAAPIYDCAQAVARAVNPIARAAQNAISTFSIIISSPP